MPLETLRIRQHYRRCTLTELKDRIAATLSPEDQPPDPAWQTWLVQYCLTKLRPQPRLGTEKEWERWIAFALRYIQPLMAHDPPMEMKPVIEAMQRRPELVKILMFGTHDLIRAVLPAAYELRSDFRKSLISPELSGDEQALFERVRADIQTSARTISDWSRYYLDTKDENALAHRIYTDFHSVSSSALLNPMRVIRETRQSRTESGPKFEAYLNLALQESAALGLVGLALGYLNEFERRQNMLLAYSRLFMRAALLLLVLFVSGPVVLSMPFGMVGNLVTAIAWGLGLLDVLFVGVLITVIIFYTHDSYTWTNTTLKTLDMLLGQVVFDAETREEYESSAVSTDEPAR